jgi:FlaA1/EpsC-like NDP-sugar epimerase
MINHLRDLNSKKKTMIVFIHDMIMAAISLYLSFAIRHDSFELGMIPRQVLMNFIFIGLAVQMITFYAFGIYKGIWRYSSLPDLTKLIKVVFIASIFTLLGLFLYNRLEHIPRSLFFIDSVLLIVTMGGGRVMYRIWSDLYAVNSQKAQTGENVLILGANDIGVQILREIRQNSNLGLDVVGFLDVNRDLKKRKVFGVPVLGTLNDIESVNKSLKYSMILIAMPEISSSEINNLVNKSPANVKIKIVPRLNDFLHGEGSFAQLRNLKIEDLLGREVVSLENEHISRMISNKTILITGAGGSIGSEISRQVLRFRPKKVIYLDSSEFNLYQLEQDLSKSLEFKEHDFVVGNIRDKKGLELIFKKFKPQVVFHAAAYKHVPMMEKNPYEAIQTNVIGTKTLATLASENLVEKFVLVSTDKAVNPTNIMGASKRIAELVCQQTQKGTETTQFITVRFGNVLGSSGSVIPLFKSQIEKGGPVTVTHKDVKRYFMSIPEASQLVLQSASIGQGGEIFVLDMGQPINIYELAKQMISLAGFIPDRDIEIQFTGLRPGEKLFEELLTTSENTVPTRHSKIHIAKTTFDPNKFNETIDQLENMSPADQLKEFQSQIIKIVKEYLSPEEHLRNTYSKDDLH